MMGVAALVFLGTGALILWAARPAAAAIPRGSPPQPGPARPPDAPPVLGGAPPAQMSGGPAPRQPITATAGPRPVASPLPQYPWETRAALPYLSAFRAAESAHGLPAGLLSRVAAQESAFNATARSRAGAIGLMQFLPATAADLGVDPLDPFSSIAGAARYLRQLFDRHGSWQSALAAYNWGTGNLARKGFAAAPPETRRYVAAIAGDVGV